MAKKGSPKRMAAAFEEAERRGVDVRETKAWEEDLFPEDKKEILSALKSNPSKPSNQTNHSQPSLF